MSHDLQAKPGRVRAALEAARAAFLIVRTFPVIVPMALIILISEMNYSGINNVALPAYLGLLPLGIAREAWITGAIASTFLLSEMVFRLPAGWLSDRFGRARMTVIGLLLLAPSFIASALAPHYQWLYGLRVWDGLMAALLFTSVYAVIGDAVPERFRANAMGVLNMMYMVGAFVGYAVAGGIDALTGHPRWFFFISAVGVGIGGLGTLIFFLRHSELDQPHPEVHLEEMEKAAVSVAHHTALLSITFLQNLALTIVAPFIYRFMTDRTLVPKGGLGLSLLELLLLMGGPVLGVAVLAIPFSRLADRVGKLTAVRAAFTVIAGVIWLFAVTRQLWALALIATVLSIAFSVGVPAWLAILSSLSGSKTRGTTLGGYGAVQGLAAVLGPLVGAFIWARFGLPHLFIASAVAIAAAALLAWTALPEHVSGPPNRIPMAE